MKSLSIALLLTLAVNAHAVNTIDVTSDWGEFYDDICGDVNSLSSQPFQDGTDGAVVGDQYLSHNPDPGSVDAPSGLTFTNAEFDTGSEYADNKGIRTQVSNGFITVTSDSGVYAIMITKTTLVGINAGWMTPTGLVDPVSTNALWVPGNLGAVFSQPVNWVQFFSAGVIGIDDIHLVFDPPDSCGCN